MNELIWPISIVIAIIIDFILADPMWLPHPIRLFGVLIKYSERSLNRKSLRLFSGFIVSMLLPGMVFLGFLLLEQFISNQSRALHLCFCTIIFFYAIAHTGLIREGSAVIKALETRDLSEAKKKLSYIVGRDITDLSEEQVVAATFETMSENLNDGVIAPLLYATLFGPAAAMTYKMINTLDSMIGYKNEKYEKFGKSSARLDDIVNFIPARLTAFLMLLASGKISRLKSVWAEASKHQSPNAGYPEAALAIILGVKLGGPASYGGVIKEKAYIGIASAFPKADRLKSVIRINNKTLMLFTLIYLLLVTGLLIDRNRLFE